MRTGHLKTSSAALISIAQLAQQCLTLVNIAYAVAYDITYLFSLQGIQEYIGTYDI